MKALRVASDDPRAGATLVDVEPDALSAGEVRVGVVYSGINYKDALAVTGRGAVVRNPPRTAGIDAVGVVEASDDPAFTPGDRVIATGWHLGETRDGGFAEKLQVPASVLVTCPDALSLWQAAAFGTAGLTAALALRRMQTNGQSPDLGEVAVTGATGGVGLIAISLLANAGFDVVAVSRRGEAYREWLRALGATSIMSPEDLATDGKPLAKGSLGGAIDAVGGDLLASILAHLKPAGNVAAVGLAGGFEIHTTVAPFILRGVSLLGIDSVQCPNTVRRELWQTLAGERGPRHLNRIVDDTVSLDGVPAVCEAMMAGGHVGRTVVAIGADT